MLVFSDASWANTEGLSSQAGYLVFLAEPEVLTTTGGTAVLVEWRTHRLKRKCKSTLTAETIAMEAATDAGLHTRQLLAEMLYEKYQPGRSGELDKTLNRMVAITDCKSLYDCLVKDGPQNSLSENALPWTWQAYKTWRRILTREALARPSSGFQETSSWPTA